nr:InlB B-repeat-containing protein [Bifidobacterium choladohabitans]
MRRTLLYSPGGGGRQTPRVTKQTPGILPSNATNTPLPSPSPLTPSSPLSSTTPSPNTPQSSTSSPDNTGSASTKPSDTDDHTSHIVRFDPADGNAPTQSTVKTGTLAAPPQQNPVREGFLFDGWTLDGQPFDLQTPILQDTTLKAQWSKTTDWTLSPDHGPASGTRLTISPPSPQEPYYVSVQTAGDQTVGLTGDGRIYTWTQDGTPKQIPSPAQTPAGFHYLQAATGSRSQAALGSDQHIYTWNSQQATPVILDTSQSSRFTSISMNDDRLLAVDRQGQVHTFQDSQTGSQNPHQKPVEQTTTRLPGQAQAVLAAASASRILALDADGQAWTWDKNNTGKAEPARIKQQPGMRTVQAQALNQGFLLLNADGQARYLANTAADSTAVNLPEGMKASSAATNNDQAMIVGKGGRLWAWKPGKAPMRTDNGDQQFVQATAAGNRIIAISRQGDIYKWSLDEQGQPGKPARLDTSTDPTLESASMDGQPLKLSKTSSIWQAEIPAHKPGLATITIAGRQDGQPFTISLNYTVDQPLTRADQQSTTHTVTFNADGGSPEPAAQTVTAPYGRVKRPTPDPARDGFQFDGWFIGEVAYDFSKPVTKDLALTAKWTESGNDKWSISPDKGSQLGNESTTIAPPNTSRGIRFSQISGSKYDGYYSYGFSLAVGSDGNAYAWGNNEYGQLGDGTKTNRTTPVMVKMPDRKTYPDLPADFTYVQVSAGYYHSLAVGSDGYAYAWGNNDNGQLGNKTSGGYSTVPVRVRDPDSPYDKSKGLQAVQVSCGTYHSLAVGADGNTYAWGYNSSGQLGDGTSNNYRYTPVRVKTPDRKTYPDLPADFTYVQVSAGYEHSLAVGSDGYAYAWGNNEYGRLGNNSNDYYADSSVPVRVRDPANPTDTSKGLQAVQVSCGTYHSLAVGSDGYAYAWGDSSNGSLGNNSSVHYPNPVPLRVHDPANPYDTSKGLQAVQVSGGYYHSLAVGSDGYAYAWGYNAFGQLGNSTSNSSTVPVHVRDPANPTDSSKGLKATQFIAGDHHSLAVSPNGYTYACGYNAFGQIGDRSTYNAYVPVPVVFNLQLVITGVKFDRTVVSGLSHGKDNSVSVLTPIHVPGTVTVSVDYTVGGIHQQPDTSLRYTYLPAGVLPRAGGEGILLALATGMTGMGGVLASRRHRRERHRLLHTSHE